MGRLIAAAVWAKHIGSARSKLVLLALADLASDDSGACVASIRHLTGITELSPSQVYASINHLEECGLLRRDSGGGRKTNVYWIDLHAVGLLSATDEYQVPILTDEQFEMAPVRIVDGCHPKCDIATVCHNPLSEEEHICLSLLAGVDGYPYDEEKDLRQIRRLVLLHPDLDVVALIERLVSWWEEDPKRLLKNPRLAIVSWAQRPWAPKRQDREQALDDDEEWNARLFASGPKAPDWLEGR